MNDPYSPKAQTVDQEAYAKAFLEPQTASHMSLFDNLEGQLIYARNSANESASYLEGLADRIFGLRSEASSSRSEDKTPALQTVEEALSARFGELQFALDRVRSEVSRFSRL